jgi:Icc-related predicted phosphoesterase
LKIVHFSDWHGRREKLPRADLYVCTGDMLPNFPLLEVYDNGRTVTGRKNVELLFGEKRELPVIYFDDDRRYVLSQKIDPAAEAELQGRWIRENLGSYRPYMESPDAPVVCVRGNHDFTDLAPAFGGDVWEVDLDPARTIEKAGLKVGGCRGIAYIVGEWSDELSEREKTPEGPEVRPAAGRFEEVAARLPTDIELLITHAPPYGMRDGFVGNRYGSRSLANYVMERQYVWGRLKMHCFGHIHSARGSTKGEDVVFSNAACGWLSYEI